jgi:RNA polymerase sigma factor (sigma-70 family)
MIVFEDLESFQERDDTWNDYEEKNEESDTRLTRVMEKIKLLPEKYRNILSLYFFEGYDHEEISQILSIPGNTSRSYFTRAKNKLISSF